MVQNQEYSSALQFKCRDENEFGYEIVYDCRTLSKDLMIPFTDTEVFPFEK